VCIYIHTHTHTLNTVTTNAFAGFKNFDFCKKQRGFYFLNFFQLHEPFHAEGQPVIAQHGFKNQKSSPTACKEMVTTQILVSLRFPQPFNSDTKGLM
jgi:hypothetical protein